MDNITAYPLSWPFGWKRTRYPDESRFGRKSFAEGRDDLLYEIEERLKGHSVVLSTNIELRLDGLPYGNRAQPDDKGVAVYFKLNKKDVALACDKWHRIEDNMRAIFKHIEALRGQDRWGVGTLDQAFQGYTAIPETTKPQHDYFKDVTHFGLKAHYRHLAKKMHPDKGGSQSEFSEMNRQYQERITELELG